MTDKSTMIPGLSFAEMDQLINPLLTIEERRSAWHARPLGIQARKVQQHWKIALKGPFRLGLASCVVAFIALTVATFSETWRFAGVTAFLLWYPVMIYVVLEMRYLANLQLKEI